MDLYATGTPPDRGSMETRRSCSSPTHRGASTARVRPQVDFEGRSGVSPREMRTLLLDAAQSVDYPCLSPFAVLFEIDELCKRTSEYDWLRRSRSQAATTTPPVP
jgi:serine protein kinase